MSENGDNGNESVTLQEEPRTRNERGYWIKGVSGNPSGVNNRGKQLSVRDLLKQDHVQKAIDLLVSQLADPDGFVAQGAARYIVDQYYGKAKQAVEITGEDGGPIQVEHTRDELHERLTRILAASRSIPEAN